MTDRDSHQEFQTTHWSVVLDARRNADENSQLRNESLRKLCEQYWRPLYAFLRRKGHSPDDAADLVQGFFRELLEKDFVQAVDKDHGRFRWFLMHAMNRFTSKQRARAAAQKRGGDRNVFSIDVDGAEQTYRNEPIDGWTAEKLFDRRWGIEVLQQALQTLQSEYENTNPSLFNALQPRLSSATDSRESYAEIATALGMKEGAVKTAAMRLRKRYRLLLRRMVAETLNEPNMIDDELDVLLNAIRGN